MNRYSFLLAFVLAALAASAQTSTRLLDSTVDLYVKQKKFNGAVLVAQKGRILLEQGYGYKNVEAKTKADARTLFQYGSVTKQFTAALVMHLQEKGKLNLQDKLSKYFPQLGFADSVTIYHLLTHTSGIYNYTEDHAFMMNETSKPATPEKMLALFSKRPLEFTPGSQFRYSNSGYSLLGYIIEKVSGTTYEKLLHDVILQPLGMHTAGFDFAHNRSADRAAGYHFIDGDKGEAAGVVDSSVSYAAGSLYGSVKDLYAWHQALQKNALLSKDSWTQVFTPFHHHYALGWSVDTLFGHRVVQHNGGIFGFTSTFKRFPEQDVVVIVLSNNSSPKVEEIANNMAALVFGQPVKWPKERKAIRLPEATLKPLAGNYQIGPGMKVSIRLEKGKLIAYPEGEPVAELMAEEENRFFIEAENFTISFDKDAQGLVTGFTMSKNGRTKKAKKLD